MAADAMSAIDRMECTVNDVRGCTELCACGVGWGGVGWGGKVAWCMSGEWLCVVGDA